MPDDRHPSPARLPEGSRQTKPWGVRVSLPLRLCGFLVVLASLFVGGAAASAETMPCLSGGPCLTEAETEAGPPSCEASRSFGQPTRDNKADKTNPSVPLCSDTATSLPAPVPFTGSDFGRIEQGPHRPMLWLSLEQRPEDDQRSEMPPETGSPLDDTPGAPPRAESQQIEGCPNVSRHDAGFSSDIERPPRR